MFNSPIPSLQQVHSCMCLSFARRQFMAGLINNSFPDHSVKLPLKITLSLCAELIVCHALYDVFV